MRGGGGEKGEGVYNRNTVNICPSVESSIPQSAELPHRS